MQEIDPRYKADLTELGNRKAKQSRNFRTLRDYSRGCGPLPDAIVRSRVTKAYRLLMPMSDAPWASVISEAVQDRLEVTGISTGDKSIDDALWDDWRRNYMDSESSLAHNATLVGGRSFVTVWPDPDGNPEWILDTSENMVVKYAPGSRRRRIVAMRHWVDDGYPYATLYYPDYIVKFKGPKDSLGLDIGGVSWEPYRPPEDQEWPLRNPYGVVPVVEIATNRELEPGCYPYARGEYENCTGVIDRINLLTFLGLVVAFYMGFPLRGVIGEKILSEVMKDDDGAVLRDDNGEPIVENIPPFDVHADSLFQLENHEARLAEFAAADRTNLSITAELEQLATVSNTPRHYFPMASGTSNIASDTVVAWEAGLHGKVKTRHKPQIGTGWEEAWRLDALMRPERLVIPNIATVQWATLESRSLAEQADAATKLKDVMPKQAIAELVLGANPETIARWEALGGSDVLSQLLKETQTPSMEPTPADG